MSERRKALKGKQPGLEGRSPSVGGEPGVLLVRLLAAAVGDLATSRRRERRRRWWLEPRTWWQKISAKRRQVFLGQAERKHAVRLAGRAERWRRNRDRGQPPPRHLMSALGWSYIRLPRTGEMRQVYTDD